MLNKDRGQAGKFVDHELVEWQMGGLFLSESLRFLIISGIHQLSILIYSPQPISCKLTPLWYNKDEVDIMKSEFTAIIDATPEGGYWAICPEIPGANGQGETVADAKDNLRQAIELILEDRRTDLLRGLPADVITETVIIG